MTAVLKIQSEAHRKTRAAEQILGYAAAIGLPAPSQVSIFKDSDAITFGLDNLADLTDWAQWMDVQITENSFSPLGHIHKARGVALEQPVEVWATTFTTAVD